MTPLTTPRTPAQILLDRNELRAKRSVGLIEPYEEEKQQQLALEIFTSFVDSVEGTLIEIAEREFDGERVIGPGIIRMCRDLAERVEELAEEVKDRGDEVYDLMLNEYHGDDASVEVVHETSSVEVGVVSHGTIYSIMTDVAASLRSVSQEEAQELAEVSMQVAMMTVWTLRLVQRNMSRMLNSHEVTASRTISRDDLGNLHVPVHHGDGLPSSRKPRVTWSTDDDSTIKVDNLANRQAKRGLGPLVEILGEEEKKDENYNSMNVNGTAYKHGFADQVTSPAKYTPELKTIPASPSSSPISHTPSINNQAPARCRVLWPPLFPAFQQAIPSCIHQAQEHPLSAAAIGLVCGPAAITTAVIIGPPILITDWVVQSFYDTLSDTPFIENIEKGTANALQVSKLAILCSKLAIKQGLTVGERQIQRRGGIDKICHDIVDGTLDGLMHPVETVCTAWEGLFWLGGVAKDAVGFVSDILNGGERVDIH